MRRIAVVAVAVALGLVAGILTRSIPASGSTTTRFSPGYLDFGSPSPAFVSVFNPTGATMHVKEQLVSPSGSLSSTADDQFDVPPHSRGADAPWFCSSGTCFALPVLTVGSSRAVVSLNYNDADLGFHTLYAGDFKRF